MGAIVDFAYYAQVYMGIEADQASFPALNAHASRIINAMTHWRVNEENFHSFPALVQTMYKLAVCSEVDNLAINGVENINGSMNGGFTVGKVTVHEGKSSEGGAMSANISPAAMLYLEQSGLMNPAVPVAGWGWP